MNIEEVVSEIEYLFDQYGQMDYIGEDITQLEHAIQVAQSAEKSYQSPSLIIAGFLHDIGHLIGLDLQKKDLNKPQNMIKDGINLGISNHQGIALDWLSKRGFSEEVTIPVYNHCLSKRYLLTVQPDYINKLSKASQETFYLQGGLMMAEEVTEFENSPYFMDSVRLRTWDDQGKKKNLHTKSEMKNLKEHYLGMIYQYLEKNQK